MDLYETVSLACNACMTEMGDLNLPGACVDSLGL